MSARSRSRSVGSLPLERDCQVGLDDGRDAGADPDAVAAEVDDLSVGPVKWVPSAGVPTCPDFKRVMPGLDRHLDRLLPFDRCDVVGVDQDVEGATSKLKNLILL